MRFSGFLKETPVCKKKTHHKNIQKSRDKGQKLAQSLPPTHVFFFENLVCISVATLECAIFFCYFPLPLPFLVSCNDMDRRRRLYSNFFPLKNKNKNKKVVGRSSFTTARKTHHCFFPPSLNGKKKKKKKKKGNQTNNLGKRS